LAGADRSIEQISFAELSELGQPIGPARDDLLYPFSRFDRFPVRSRSHDLIEVFLVEEMDREKADVNGIQYLHLKKKATQRAG
jgi:hypothetical protein